MSASLDVATRGTVGDTSPNTRQRLTSFGKNSVLWLVVIAVVLIATILTFLSQLRDNESRGLHYNNFDRDGTAAVAGILRSHNINTSTTEDYDEALNAAHDANTTLVVLSDSGLEQSQLAQLGDATREDGSHLVLVSPDYNVGNYTTKIASQPINGNVPLRVAPDCTFGPAARAGEATTGVYGYRAVNAQSSQACYPYTTTYSGLVHVQDGSGTFTVLGNAEWMYNSLLREDGNAALVIGTIADKPNVVLYYANEPVSAGSNPIQNTPPWIFLSMVWMLPVFVVAVIWAGRRFGPLAVETLPVTVPPIETVTGHAGLMHRTGDRVEALRVLRAAALVRMGRTLAVPSNAGEAEVCQAIAQRTGIALPQLEYVLVTAQPGTDTELSELATRISQIESEVRAL